MNIIVLWINVCAHDWIAKRAIIASSGLSKNNFNYPQTVELTMCEEITIHRQLIWLLWKKYYPQIVDSTIYEVLV